MKVKERESKRHLAAEIEAAVLDGTYRPGEWLRQIDLEGSFRANRFDVRRALTELATRGTVTHVVNRGYYVSVPDLHVIRELIQIRAILEVEAALQALPNIGAAELLQIKKCQEAFERAMVYGTSADQANTNMAFHDSIYRYASNRSLAELIVQVRNRALRGPIVLWPSHAKLQRSAEHHREIVAAIETRNAKSLKAAVSRHIRESKANYPTDEDGEG
jgi:DNA-binding GntR family transcriptional regulator